MKTKRRTRGFTLVESMVAVAVAGILGSVAWPSLEGHLQRARRADALLALMQTQLAQERYRLDHLRYGSLAEIGLPATSPGGHYAIVVESADAAGFALRAEATGRQARDATCRVLRLSSGSASPSYASGATSAAGNGTDTNRRCWNQ
jgi:type IV pilus assembly protein PilE